MHAIYAFGLLILIAFLGSRFLFKRHRKLSPFNYFVFSGLIYVFLGLFLGKSGSNVINQTVLEGFYPLIGFGLGWIGFLFGFQLERRYIKRFPKRYIGLSGIQSVFVLLLMAFALLPLLNVFFAKQPPFLLYGMAVSFGILGTINSPSVINVASSAIPSKGNYYYLARFITSVSGFWGILGLALLSSFWHYPFFEGRILFRGLVLFCSATVFAAGAGILFHLLTRKKATDQDLLVYLLGFIFFASGAAFYFNVPPLYIGMVLGLTYSNLSKTHEDFYPLLFSTEKPLYITFLILIGTLWEFHLDFPTAMIILVLLLTRILAFTLPLPFFRRVLRFSFSLPPRFGLSFLSSGGIGVAFAVSVVLSFPMPLTDVFLTAALVSIIINELLCPIALKVSLIKLDREE